MHLPELLYTHLQQLGRQEMRGILWADLEGQESPWVLEDHFVLQTLDSDHLWNCYWELPPQTSSVISHWNTAVKATVFVSPSFCNCIVFNLFVGLYIHMTVFVSPSFSIFFVFNLLVGSYISSTVKWRLYFSGIVQRLLFPMFQVLAEILFYIKFFWQVSCNIIKFRVLSIHKIINLIKLIKKNNNLQQNGFYSKLFTRYW